MRRRDIELKDLECVWVQVKLRGHDILICVIYRSPNSTQNYSNLSNESIDGAQSTSIQDTAILGDLNNDLLVNNRSKNLQQPMNTYNLKQLINEPTHFTESFSSHIDVILVYKTNNLLVSDVCDPFITFHCPIAVLLKCLKPKRNCYTRKVWKYDLGDYCKYRRLLSAINWDDVLMGSRQRKLWFCIYLNIYIFLHH